MNVESILHEATNRSASDIYIVAGRPVTFKVNGFMVPWNDVVLSADDTREAIKKIYSLANNRDFSRMDKGDDDFALPLSQFSRFRVNTYRQRGSIGSVIRMIPIGIPDPAKINIPDIVMDLANYSRGVVLFTGTTGSGKTTSLACLIDKINKTRSNHIITIEDPIEYLHSHKKSIISQREIESDTDNYLTALRAAMRQVPDVILVGEMRDHETISAAITAAETGHLVFSTLHTIGAAATVDRIIDVFPPNQQNQIRTQLAMTLQAVISQQLVPTNDKKLHPAFEIMIVNTAIRNMIRENKVYQIDNTIQTSASQGMKMMDTSLYELCKKNIISRENALLYSVNQSALAMQLGGGFAR